MGKAVDEKTLTGDDVLLARRRAKVTQKELAKELSLWQMGMTQVEDGRMRLEQEQYREMLAAIERIAKRKRAKAQEESTA